MKSGYLYVLTHPSDPKLIKIGQTTRDPNERLAEHNSNYEEYTGQVVKETGQKWVLKTYIPVIDPYYAETVFWGATGIAAVPFRRGIEIERNTKTPDCYRRRCHRVGTWPSVQTLGCRCYRSGVHGSHYPGNGRRIVQRTCQSDEKAKGKVQPFP